MQIKLGEKMRALRRRDGRTQEELAQALGVTAQAVSRWENSLCYPDMALIPSMANFFGVSIDELFGYQNERTSRVDELVHRIRSMNEANNGRDICMDECIRLAREGLAEFPRNEKLMLCLASVLYNAGYIRYGEHHLTDAEGCDVYDTERHRTYTEWQEAIKLYEKLLTTLEEGELRHQAVRELIQLYANIGESEKAIAVAEACTELRDCQEFMLASACDGRKRAEHLGKALLELVSACVEQMVQCLIAIPNGSDPVLAAQVIQNAIAMFDLLCTDGQYGLYNELISRLYLYLSEHQWRAGDRDGAFASLERALDHARAYESCNGRQDMHFTAPLLQTVKINPEGYDSLCAASNLSEAWPWWCVPDYSDVKEEIQRDPRWHAWVERTKQPGQPPI